MDSSLLIFKEKLKTMTKNEPAATSAAVSELVARVLRWAGAL